MGRTAPSSKRRDEDLHERWSARREAPCPGDRGASRRGVAGARRDLVPGAGDIGARARAGRWAVAEVVGDEVVVCGEEGDEGA